MWSHGLSAIVPGVFRGHERISGSARAAAASEDLFDLGVHQHGARAGHQDAGEDNLHRGEAALVRLQGRGNAPLIHDDKTRKK